MRHRHVGERLQIVRQLLRDAREPLLLKRGHCAGILAEGVESGNDLLSEARKHRPEAAQNDRRTPCPDVNVVGHPGHREIEELGSQVLEQKPAEDAYAHHVHGRGVWLVGKLQGTHDELHHHFGRRRHPATPVPCIVRRAQGAGVAARGIVGGVRDVIGGVHRLIPSDALQTRVSRRNRLRRRRLRPRVDVQHQPLRAWPEQRLGPDQGLDQGVGGVAGGAVQQARVRLHEVHGNALRDANDLARHNKFRCVSSVDARGNHLVIHLPGDLRLRRPVQPRGPTLDGARPHDVAGVLNGVLDPVVGQHSDLVRAEGSACCRVRVYEENVHVLGPELVQELLYNVRVWSVDSRIA
mmetsp:Transcript_48915/g.126916  ORF Transcript_48915/g.126916 Transcript_48915/m.126916 type:complete len:352 (-) Transcript_48915:456-1511(-)